MKTRTPSNQTPPGGESRSNLSLPLIARHWIAAMARGQIAFVPDRVFTRSVSDDGIHFQLIFNAARKDRGQSKAA